jgi:hypothetical protein
MFWLIDNLFSYICQQKKQNKKTPTFAPLAAMIALAEEY